jgi:hypothetical protein
VVGQQYAAVSEHMPFARHTDMNKRFCNLIFKILSKPLQQTVTLIQTQTYSKPKTF